VPRPAVKNGSLTCPRGGETLRAMRNGVIHPGITMHKIPVEGAVGLVFAVGVVVTTLLSLPEARWFLAMSLPTGVVIGIILRMTRRD